MRQDNVRFLVLNLIKSLGAAQNDAHCFYSCGLGLA